MSATKYVASGMFMFVALLAVILLVVPLDEPTIKPAQAPRVTINMPDGYPDVIMNCSGSTGVYTNLKGALALQASDPTCDPPTIEVPE